MAFTSSSLSTDPAAGYFGPGTAIWQVDREYALMLGSMRALLLQIAHPAVAAGVSRYSQFEQDVFGRAQRTFTTLSLIIFGDSKQAKEAGNRLVASHRDIRGDYSAGDHRRPYQANDPKLKLWVLATIIDTNMMTYEFIHGPQTEAFKERFYEDWKVAGKLMGIPGSVFPVNWHSFQAYMQQMLSPGVLQIGDTGRTVCRSIIYHRHMPTFLLNWLAIGFLPRHISESLGLKCTDANLRNARRFLRMLRIVDRLLPASLRYIPAYFQARNRIALARQQTPAFNERFYTWLGQNVELLHGLPKQDLKV